MLGGDTGAESVVLYSQEGVCVTRNVMENVIGSLFIVHQRNHYVVWLPYTYLFCIAPQHVSSAARSTIATESYNLPIGKERITKQRPEWRSIICFPLHRLSKVVRRGRRVKTITLVRDGTVTEPTLRFQDGGCTKFWDLLSSILKLRGDPRSAEEFIVDGLPDVDFLPSSPPEVTAVRSAGAQSENGSGGFMSFMGRMRTVIGGSPQTPSPISNRSLTQSVVVGTLAPDPIVRRPEGERKSSGLSNKGGPNRTTEMLELHMERKQSFTAPKLRKSERCMSPHLDEITWMNAMDSQGRIDSSVWLQIKAQIYCGGMQPSLRKEVWPFLLGMYKVDSTIEERDKIRKERADYYFEIKQQWQSIRPEQASRFTPYRERFKNIDTDIVRTDRSLSEYESDDSPLLKTLRHILYTYSFFNFDLGYCQGMTDMASPLLLVLRDEADAFWAFSHLMDAGVEGNFHAGSTNSMHQQLSCVIRLIQIFVPTLAEYLETINGSHLSFTFRWLLVRYKREFSIDDVMTLWEVAWSCPHTTDHHLIVAVTLLRELAPTILEVGASFEDLLRMTNDMSNKMNVKDVILFSQDMYAMMCEQYTRRVNRLAWPQEPLKEKPPGWVPSLSDILSAFEDKD